MLIEDLLAFVIEQKASDLHLSAGSPPSLRVNGDLKRLNTPPLSGEEIHAMLATVMSAEQIAEYDREFDLDMAIAFEDARFRLNAFRNVYGPSAVLRTIPTKVPSLADLNAPEIFKRLAQLHRGLVLVTGPTGSGKSTTLAAIIDHINATEERHILTVEDPVEFVHRPKRSVVNHREVGRSTHSFARALKSALREDPDVILVGEMRDRETISLALTAAETGHLVFGTLHTNSAPKTIDRIVDVFPAGDKDVVRAMISGSLEAVIAQLLLRRADRPGRVAAHEIMIGTPAIRNLIRENKTAQLYSMLQVGSRYGMQTLKDAVERLRSQGTIDDDEARRALAVAADEEEGAASVPPPQAARQPAPAAPAPPQRRVITAPPPAEEPAAPAPAVEGGPGRYSF